MFLITMQAKGGDTREAIPYDYPTVNRLTHTIFHTFNQEEKGQ
jgi:hypothetical protein